MTVTNPTPGSFPALNPQPVTVKPDCPLFICYRRTDGEKGARWLHEHLEGRLVRIGDQPTEEGALSIYLDVAAPAVGNWLELHGPALSRARALLVLVTPGLRSKLKPEDWVYRELEWWLDNRKVAPILVDLTGEGERWLPTVLRARWPHAQRVPLPLEEWSSLEPSERARQEALAVESIRRGIELSEQGVRFEDLEKQKALIRRLGRSLAAMTVAMIGALVAAVLAISFAKQASHQEEEVRQQLSRTYSEQADRAWARGDGLAARILSAQAFHLAPSAEANDRLLAIHFAESGEFERASQRLEASLRRSYEGLVSEPLLPRRAEHFAHASTIQPMLENYVWLALQAGQNPYGAVVKLKGLEVRLSRLERVNHRSDGADMRLVSQLEQAEAEFSHLYSLAETKGELPPANAKWEAAGANLFELYDRAARPALRVRRPEVWEEAPGWEKVQSALLPEEAIVDFVRIRDSYAAWVLGAHGPPRSVNLGGAEDLRKLLSGGLDTWALGTGEVRGHRSLFAPGHTVPSNRERLLRIRRLVWEPIELMLPSGIQTVYLIPDEVLSAIPFAALPGSTAGTSLIDHLTVAYLRSATDLLVSRPLALHGGRWLMVADAGGEASNVGISERGRKPLSLPRLAPLPGARAEVEAIAKLVGSLDSSARVEVLLGSDATELAIRKESPRAMIVHFSVHSFDWRRPLKEPQPSVLGEPSALRRFLSELNPFLSSFFLLAAGQSNEGMDDGILSAFEISGIDFRSAQLVTLPVCEDRSQGIVLEFVDAFREAGAERVLATLDIVDDDTAGVAMIQFYQHLLAKVPPATALRKAMLKLKENGSPERHWVPYVYYGPNR